jgi:hypothetical protein
VGDERFHVAGVVGNQREPRNRASTATEYVRGHLANRLQHSAYVVGQQVRLGVLVGVVDRAAGETSGVVSHDGVSLGEQSRDRGKPGSAHGMADQHECRA